MTSPAEASCASIWTFLFTDIEASSLKWLAHKESMKLAVEQHDDILRRSIESHKGRIFKTGGDAFYAIFNSPNEALKAAVRAQRELSSHAFSAVGGLRVRMAVHLGTASERSGDYFGPALNCCARLLSLAHGGQILTSASLAALTSIEHDIDAEMRYVGDYALDDPQHAVPVYQIVGSGLASQFPPLRGRRRERSNVPSSSSSLIGRQRQIEGIETILSANRLVTLTGMGGVGKTRLALEVGRALLQQFSDGVWYVELAPVAEGSLIPSVIASALMIELPRENSQLDWLSAYLESRSVLLILDNCEHLLGDVAFCCQSLLAKSAKLKILTTSQEALRVPGEHVYVVPPLSLPLNVSEAVEQVQQSEAVQLFCQRVMQSDATFGLNSYNSSAIATVCKRLDGIPLALELAAARAVDLGIEEVARRLDQRFKLLSKGARGVLARHQTLRSTLDWSYGLLSEPESSVLRRISIFASGFTLPGALAVSGLDDSEVVDCMSGLAARSLVARERDGQETRYRLLETVRLYAREKLFDANETAETKIRFTDYLRIAFDNAYDKWWRLGDTDWLRLYAPELDNVRAALDWSFEPNGKADAGIAITASAVPLFQALSLGPEYRRRLETASAALSARTPPELESRLCLGICNAYRISNPERALIARQRAVILYRELGDDLGLARALGFTFSSNADQLEAKRALEEASALTAKSDSARLQAHYFGNLGGFQLAVGEVELARASFEQSLRLCRLAGADAMALTNMCNLGDAAWALGRLSDAVLLFTQALDEIKGAVVGRRYQLAHASASLASLLAELGRVEEARTVTLESATVLLEQGLLRTYAAHLALPISKLGMPRDAALLMGFADTVERSTRARMQYNAVRARDAALANLNANLRDGDLQMLFAQGAAMSDRNIVLLVEHACRGIAEN